MNSNGHRPDCDGCVPCQEDACGEIAYCVNERPTGNLCEHHVDAVCPDHWPGTCIDCRLEAEREMHASGEYDPRADPFYRPEKHAADTAYWERPALNMPGSPGYRRDKDTA